MKNSSSYNVPKTLSQSIYHSLKDAIINNELKAGQRIYEKDVASRYDVSTTPVREALLRLSAEGYISIDSQRKASVRQISFEELKDIFMVMGDIDALAVCQVVDHITPDCIQKIEDLTAEMEKLCKPTFVERFLALDNAIHSKIWSVLPNRILEQILQSVHGKLLRYNYALYVAYQDPEIMGVALSNHKKIANALLNKDKRELKKLVKTHWSFFIQHVHLRNKFLNAFKGP